LNTMASGFSRAAISAAALGNPFPYELIPNSTFRFQNVLVKTNSMGFRDREYPKTKAAGRFRIVGLGDSVMFGWGVPEEDCYLAKLETAMNKQDSVVFEVVNTAVPGYNTVMEIETLKEKFDLEEVDLVVVNFVGNDLDLPNFIRKKPAYFGIKKSLILQRFDDNDGVDKNLGNAPFNPKSHSYRPTSENIPAEYRSMVGVGAYIAAMEELNMMQEKYGFEVIILSTDPDEVAPDFVKNTCNTLGFYILEIMPSWKKFYAENPDAKWRISSNDGHPSVLGHRLIADELGVKIRQIREH